MRNMFFECESLKSLPDISNWNTSKVTDMSWMFGGCKNLESLPDISKWDTRKVIDMSSMFFECRKLQSLDTITFNVMENCNREDIDYNCMKEFKDKIQINIIEEEPEKIIEEEPKKIIEEEHKDGK